MKLFKKHQAKPAKRIVRTPFLDRVFNLGNKLTIGSLMTLGLLLVLIVGSTLVVVKLNSKTINHLPVQAAHINISSKTKAQLTQFTQTSSQIKLLLIVEVDTQNNLRRNSWWFIVDPKSDKVRIEESAALPLPLFNTDPKNTQQMIAVLNNEFICTTYADTIYAQSFGIIPPIQVLCQLAIPPPRFGAFAGMLVFGLITVPTKEEKTQLRLEASRIAVELFLRGEIK